MSAFKKFVSVVLSTLCVSAMAEAPIKVQTQCQACHGLYGVATLPGAPNLSGQQKDYLVRQLQQYRSGERQNEQMSVVSKPLTDTDIEQISDWYASIKISVPEMTN